MQCLNKKTTSNSRRMFNLLRHSDSVGLSSTGVNLLQALLKVAYHRTRQISLVASFDLNYYVFKIKIGKSGLNLLKMKVHQI